MDAVAQPNRFFPYLFESGYIGTLKLKNRIVMSPMGTQLASDTGAVTSRMIDHYVRRAVGEVGLIIVEFTCVDYPRGKGHCSQLALHDDKLLAGHGDLVDAVHREGSKISIQLHHAGGNTSIRRTEGMELVAPGPLASRPAGAQPRILARAEIEELVEKFARAVERARMAGYDAVELHGAHGYLIAEFMSGHTNTRMDEYGGSIEGRMKFPLDIIRRTKQLVGTDFPLTMRLSAQEFVPGGRTLGESKVVARMLEAAGLAGLHVTAGVDTDLEWMVDPIYHPQGSKVHMASAIKQAVGIPVIAVGVIRDPGFAEEVLSQGKADFVALGRGLLTDPDWPRKAAAGTVHEIRKCFSCNHCDGVRNALGLSIRCVMNTEVGQPRGGGVNLAKTSRARQIVVVGGGPAGMEAARVAALRGHQVTLFEGAPALGGQLLIAAKVPGKEKINWLLEDLMRELAKSPAEVRLRCVITAETIRELGPEVVVLATGAEPAFPPLPGVKGSNVTTAWAVLTERFSIHDGRVTVIGGSSTGCEIALHLACHSDIERVVLLEQLSDLATEMEPFARSVVLKQICENPRIELNLGWKVETISTGAVTAIDCRGSRRVVNCDYVVLATGVKPDDSLQRAIDDAGLKSAEIFSIGDASRPGNIAAALADGRALGGQL